MKKFLLFLLLSILFNFLNAQDIIYTISGKIDNQTTSIDSILVNNISNNTQILFGNLPNLPDYNINLTQKKFWGATGIRTFGKNKGFVVAGNYPGILRLAYDENTSSVISLMVYNMQGQKVYGFNNQVLSKGNVLNIHLGHSRFYIIKIESEFGVQTFNAVGSSRLTNKNISVTISGYPIPFHGFKSTPEISDNDFSFSLGDSIRISVYKKSYYAYPVVLKVSGSGSFDFLFKKSTVDSTGISDVYVNLNDTSSNTTVTNYDTLSGDIHIKYSGKKPDLKVGDIVTVDMDTTGYLRKVVSTTVDKDSTITITTAQAYLNEVFVNKDIKLNTKVMEPKTTLKSTSTYSDIAKALTDENGYIHPVKIIYHDNQGKLRVINVLKNYELKNSRVSIIDFYRNLVTDLYGKEGDKAHFYIKKGHVSLTSDAIFEMDFKGKGALSKNLFVRIGSLVFFKFYLDSRAEFFAKLGLDLQAKYEKEKTKKLINFPEARAKFIVPPGIPVWIAFDYDLYGRFYFKSDASMDADWGFESDQTLKVGGIYTKATNNFVPIKEYSSRYSVFPLNLSGEINDTARLEIYPRVDIKFYNILGPYAEIVPYVTGNYHAKWQSQVTANGSQNFLAWNSAMDLGLDFRVGAELTFLWHNEEFVSRTVNCFDKTLWSSPKYIKLLTTIPANVTKGTKINLTYQVKDLLNNSVPACPVYFDGDGSFDHQLVLTDKNGKVTAEWTVEKSGENTIQATVYNADESIIDYISSGVIVNNPTPVADLTATPTSGTAPLSVTFTDKSTNTPTGWQWDFGDGNTSTKQNPNHTYQKAGTYTVKLTVGNNGGSNTKTKKDYITVKSEAPVAGFTATPTSGTAPLSVSFTDKSTNTPTSWQWDFGDGSASTDQTPGHTYQKAGTYTVKLTVGNNGGSNTKTRKDYIAVNSNGGGAASTFTDPRDEQTYKTVKIGIQTWFAQNLNYNTYSSWWYNNSSTNGDVYGRLYTWEAAKTACPSGWHLPSDDEWTTLIDFLGGSNVAGGKMKESGTAHWNSLNTDATNSSGFTALPGGLHSSDGSFGGLGYYGDWWSSSEYSGTFAWSRYLFYYSGQVSRLYSTKPSGLSVRCLKN